MKTILAFTLVAASLNPALAQEQVADASEAADYPVPVVTYETPAVIYEAPVAYYGPVVYQAPVVYYAPVYYLTPTVPVGYCPSDYGPEPSTVVYIHGSGGPRYSYNWGDSGSTVIYFGGGQRAAWSRGFGQR
jgi:hypothetical protein